MENDKQAHEKFPYNWA